MQPEYRVLIGDVREKLAELPACSVHCCVSSPPYFALRSYLPADHPSKAYEIGREPTPEAFIETMVEVYREVRRVLRDDGVIFVNLGDSYANDGSRNNGTGLDGKRRGGMEPSDGTWQDAVRVFGGDKRKMFREAGYAHGSLLNIPHRVAEALRADGWIWRQTIIWGKKSPMPESVGGWRWVRCRVKVAEIGGRDGSRKSDSDRNGRNLQAKNDESSRRSEGTTFCNNPAQRGTAVSQWSPCPGCDKCTANGGWVLRRGKGRCTNAHEYIFVFSKSERYFWDSEASKEASVNPHLAGKSQRVNYADETKLGRSEVDPHSVVRTTERNPRTVWTLSSEPTSEKHFATFPSELVRRCLVAGVSAGGCCPHCGSPWAPMVETERVATRPGTGSKVYIDPEGSPYEQHSGTVIGNRDPQRHNSQSRCLGYRQTCTCPVHEAVPCTVLDQFSGMGTTLQTARHLGHNGIGCELNPEYAALSLERIDKQPRWWLRQQKNGSKKEKNTPMKAQLPLFDGIEDE